MNIRLLLLLSLLLATRIAAPAAAQSTDSPPRQRRPDPENAHDPSTILIEEDVARLVCTGWGLQVKREDKQGRWLTEASIFSRDKLPEWHQQLVPDNRGHLWAPDVIQLNNRLLVYYSVSSFGKNTSAIGLVEGRTLNSESDQWEWTDRGPVIRSVASDRFNAIDPAVFAAADGRLWMTFGSFWDGLQLVELDPASGLLKTESPTPVRLAWQQEIEAPFLTHRDGWYYLFLNHGKCCRGVESTYEIVVGRSRSITGPYLDADGRELLQAGGRSVLKSHERWIGPGHASLLHRDGREWLVHHYYDREQQGRSRVRLVELYWTEEGWPETRLPDSPQKPDE